MKSYPRTAAGSFSKIYAHAKAQRLKVPIACVMAFLLAGAIPLSAQNVTWSGSNGTSFSDSLNWVGGVGPLNSLTGNLAVFSGAPTANLPQLTSSWSVLGMAFNGTASGGWVLGSDSGSNVLSIGASGISSLNTSGTNTISANLGLGANQTWNQSSGGTLRTTGNITMGSSGTPLLLNWTLGGVGGGAITIDPTTGRSVGIYSSSAASTGVFNVAKTVNLGSSVNSTDSVNVISTTGSTSAIRVTTGGSLNVYSGTWKISDLGHNSATAMNGNVTLSGGSLLTGGARYVTSINGAAGGNFTINGGALFMTGNGTSQSSGGQFGVGGATSTSSGASDSLNFNVQSGFLDVAKAVAASNIGGAQMLNSPRILFNQSGGVAQFGVTAATNVFTGASVANTNSNVTIGVTGNVTHGSKAAYTLTGGRLVIAGTLAGNAPTAGNGGMSNFNFMGGTLTAGTINASNLGSSSTATATANQVAASANIGTFINYGGTLAPGGEIVTNTPDSFGNAQLSFTPTAGRTTITGNYLQQSGGTLAINIGGTTAASAFQEAVNSGRFSNISVSGTTTLGGLLTANLIAGTGGSAFVPANGNTFLIINSAGALTGTFANANNKVLVGNDPFSFALTINYNSNNVTLSGYAANEWQGSGGGGNWGTASLWTNAVDPNAAGAGARFGAAGSGNTSVTLNADRTVGQLVFSSANYTIGGAGTLTLNNTTSAATITVQDATTQTISAPIAMASDLLITGFSGGNVVLGNLTGSGRNLTANVTGSTVTLTGSNTYNATTIASGVTLRVGSGGVAGNLGSGTTSNSGNLIFNRSDSDLSVASVINGSGNLTQAGAGTVTLTGTNAYTGTTAIAAGTLRLAGNGTLGGNTSTLGVIASGAVLDLNGTSQTVAGFSGTSAGQIQNNSGGGVSVLTLGGSTPATFAGVVADNNGVATGGRVGIALSGTGAVTLAGNNTYSGGTVVGGSSTLVISGISTTSGSNILGGSTGTGNVTFASGASLNNTSSANLWYSNALSVEGTLNLVGSNRLNLTFKTMELNGGSRTLNVNGKSLAVTGGNTLALETTGLSQWEIANITALGAPVIQNGVLNLQTTAFSGANYGAMRINNATNFANADLIGGNNVLLMAGNSITLGSNASTSPNVTVDGILNLVASAANNRNVNVKSLAGGGSVFASMVAANTNNVTLTLNGATGTTDFSGTIANGPGTGALALVKNGASTQILSGANSYTGNTTLSAGTLRAAAANSLGSTGNILVSGSGSTLEVTASGAVNDSAAVTLAGGRILRGSGVNETFGALTLTSASSLDFGSTGSGTLNFGIYANGGTQKLTVSNFLEGNVLTFKTDLSSSISNTSLFEFDNGFTSAWDNGSSTFTITAVPEPSTLIAAALLLGLLAWGEWKRLRKLAKVRRK